MNNIYIYIYIYKHISQISPCYVNDEMYLYLYLSINHVEKKNSGEKNALSNLSRIFADRDVWLKKYPGTLWKTSQKPSIWVPWWTHRPEQLEITAAAAAADWMKDNLSQTQAKSPRRLATRLVYSSYV